ncbi:hypothetical protein SDC9_114793 [bioreactor metagenome]|uniref:Uncharacterized protein n=1 Tax=bioreactor metagenome TaxID=1076179 RepID=A0A645BS05_9ZZZZ
MILLSAANICFSNSNKSAFFLSVEIFAKFGLNVLTLWYFSLPLNNDAISSFSITLAFSIIESTRYGIFSLTKAQAVACPNLPLKTPRAMTLMSVSAFIDSTSLWKTPISKEVDLLIYNSASVILFSFARAKNLS